MKFDKEAFKKDIKKELSNLSQYKLLKTKIKWERFLRAEKLITMEISRRVEAIIEVINELLV